MRGEEALLTLSVDILEEAVMPETLLWGTITRRPARWMYPRPRALCAMVRPSIGTVPRYKCRMLTWRDVTKEF